MNARYGFLAYAVVTCLALQAEVVHAEGSCFDFATPTVNRLLDKEHVQRMVILAKTRGQEARQATASLAHEAKKRGIEPVVTRVGLARPNLDGGHRRQIQ